MMTSNIMTNGEDITLSSPVCKFMASSSSIFLRIGGKLEIFNQNVWVVVIYEVYRFKFTLVKVNKILT